MQLTKKVLSLSKKYPTPSLLFDLNRISENYRRIKKSINGVEVFYAMKANDHPTILKLLIQEGSSFEISSINELKTLLKLKIPVKRIICFNSIKSPEFLSAMHKYGVDIMAFDSIEEINKITKYAPKGKVVIRIVVSNEGSDWPLTKKFGVDPAEALPLLKYARKKGLDPIGITFHVGSQCLNKKNWISALYSCNEIWKEAENHDIYLSFLSLGGGLPIKHLKQISSIEDIGSVINNAVEHNFKSTKTELRISIEPGRGLVGDAAIMVSSVVGKAKRGNEDWIYIDVGVFNGLMETIENFTYEIKTANGGKKKTVTIGGPSCDCVDIPFKNVPLPDVKTGERIYIINAGAYTNVYASSFNGFSIPKVYFIKP